MHALISVYLIASLIVAGLAMYLLPAIIAWHRHALDLATVIVNVALGWTFLGWIFALALATRRPAQPAVHVIGQLNQPACDHLNGHWDHHAASPPR